MKTAYKRLNRNDRIEIDVVLGFESLEDYINFYYLTSPPSFGTTIGRFAGRTNNAEFSIKGKKVFLNKFRFLTEWDLYLPSV